MLNFLLEKTLEIRKLILKTAINAKKGHIPPALSWVEIGVSIFYSKIFRLDKKFRKDKNRDIFLLSKGHGCLTLYSILADLNFFKKKELDNFSSNGSLLPGHPDFKIPGVENCSGSLGHGLGVAAGMAYASKIKNTKSKIVVLLGDAECQEGSVWEAAMFSGKNKLNNLLAIIDRNRLGSTDFTENYAPLEPLKKKFESFGWRTFEVDGHNILKIIRYLNNFKNQSKLNDQRPTCLICKTTKGKGVYFMESSKDWHHQMPSSSEIEIINKLYF